jgi:glycosyltransferase involved in cell wall biosynthesis
MINHTNLDSIDLLEFDVVYSPSQPIDVSKYPNTKFLFGPHFSVFPEKNQMDIIRGKNVVYIQPSDWVVKLWKGFSICQNVKIESLPFGVDTERFKDINPILERDKVFIYFKRRTPNELHFLENFLNSKNISYHIFSYINSYDDNYLQNSKYGIWLDAHESQGFALEEALSCNVPLLVWNVNSMNQEHGSNYNNIPATTIPYWDERCGEYFYNINEVENIFNLFITKLESYRPREYILEIISIEKCEEKFINIVNDINL